MAEPASRLPEEDRSDIRPDIPGLRTQEGVGTNIAGRPRSGGFSDSTHSSSGRRGEGANNSTAPSVAGSLAGSELKAAPGEGQPETGFNFSPVSNSTLTGKLRGFIGGNRRKLIIGGGATGVIITGAFVGFTFVAGPGQLIQLSQILQRNSHSSDTASQNRLGKLFRYYRTGSIGQTRLGFLQRHFEVFDNTISQLKDIGIEFQRDSLDHIKSATIDTGRLSQSYPELKGMSVAEKRSFLAEKFGLSGDQLVKIGSGSDVTGTKFAINTRDFGIKATRVLTKSSLAGLEDGGIITGIKFRALTDFFNLPSLFHPIEKLKASQEQKLSTKAGRAAAEEARQIELEKPAAAVAEPIESDLKSKLNGQNVAAGALLLTAGMCVVRSAADDAVKFNRAAIVVPATVQAADKTAVGSQVQASVDSRNQSNQVASAQVGGVVEGFTDSNGKTVWQGKALQVLAGTGQTGEDLPLDYKQAFSKNTTAQNIKDTIGGAGFGSVACSTPGLIIQGVAGVALAVGSILTAVQTGGASVAAEIAKVSAGTGATAGVIYLFQHQFTKLLEDKAVVPAVLSGPLGGNLLAYGSREAYNTAGRASGEVPLSNQESAMLDRQQQIDEQQQFRSESLFARVFDVNDYRSLTGKLADSVSPSLTQNVASLAHSFTNIGSLFTDAFSSLLPKTHAADSYDWGFLADGIPSKVLNNPDLQDPYDNADKIVALLDGDGGQSLLGKAKTCFGVDINKDSGVWDVVEKNAVNPNSDDYVNAHCDDISDENWQRMILFVFDTATLKAVDCYQSDSDTSDQSCADLGAGTSSQATAPGDTPPVTTDPNFEIKKLDPPIPGAACGCTINPTGITLHWWGSQFGQGIQPLVDIFKSNGLSVQVAITSDGEVYQMTEHLNDKANHAIGGNATTIGIEIEGGPAEFGKEGLQKYPKKFAAVVATVKYLVKKYNIPLDGPATCDAVVGIHPHSAYNNCPGAVHKDDIDPDYFNAVMQQVRGG